MYAVVGFCSPLAIFWNVSSEAMKMETPLTSPYDAVVRAVNVAEGDEVAGGAVLVELED